MGVDDDVADLASSPDASRSACNEWNWIDEGLSTERTDRKWNGP